MVAYATAPGDVEMGPEERTVVLVEKKSPLGWILKVSVALLVAALYFVGVLLFAWNWRPDMMVSFVLSLKVCFLSNKKRKCLLITLINVLPSIQTNSGQTEALIKTDSAEKTGNYKHGCLCESKGKKSKGVFLYLSLCGLYETSSHLSSSLQIPTTR